MSGAMIASAAVNAAASVPAVEKYLGETMGFWIQTGAFVLSAIAAVVVIWVGSASAKKRATIDLILSHSADEKLKEALTKVYTFHDAKKKLTSLPEGSEDRAAVLLVLNHTEFVALGIRNGAFDEKIYQELKHSDIMRLWEACGSLIEEMRSQKRTRTIFQEFEWLVRRWRSKPLKCHIDKAK